ncbi:TPA: N-formylglutamate amidohydrolase [Klebsiella pneumoniae]|uniref:N-formylglutamate amidohydrolase n=1 Tax=Klebsiella pneumoniae complex TaxID=3390273 RepID=UPI000DE69879|nr:Predicted N-formylglutamate amidohydrolase [Klebsiella pneumoniae]HCI6090876.1 N-formylglutamate amidohydrolase [Klebsiella pneumoniae]
MNCVITMRFFTEFSESREQGFYQQPAFTVERGDSKHPVILVCEHASAHIPEQLGSLGLSEEASQEHIAWDIGALALAKELSDNLGATLIAANYSRLLIDLNRPLEAPDSIPKRSEIYEIPGNQDLDEITRKYRIETLFAPFHQRLSELINARLANEQTVRVIGVHSFTPLYFGKPRSLEVGVLYAHAQDYAGRMLEGLASRGVKSAANQPYEINNLEDMTVPVHGDNRGIDAVLIEVRNDLLRTSDAVRAWSEVLAPLL